MRTRVVPELDHDLVVPQRGQHRLQGRGRVRAGPFVQVGARRGVRDPVLGRRERLLAGVGVGVEEITHAVDEPPVLRQGAAGVEVDLPWSTIATVTVFDAVFMDMTDSIGVRPPGNDANQIPRSLGGVKGVEVYLRRPLTRSRAQPSP